MTKPDGDDSSGGSLTKWVVGVVASAIVAALAFLVFLPSSLLLFRPEVLGFDPARLTSVLVGGTLFYIGFTGLEPILPSLVSRFSPENAYGTALGVYNTLQFAGSFVGGSLAGALSHLPATHTMRVLIGASLLGFLLMLPRSEH